MPLHPISQTQFNTIDGPRQIIAHDSPRRFVVLQTQTAGVFGVCWNSDLIEPVVQVQENHLWIGVDQRLAVIDLESGRVVLSLGVSGALLNIYLFDELAVVLTDIAAIGFNRSFTERCHIHCEELPVTVERRGGKLRVVLEDGRGIVIPEWR